MEQPRMDTPPPQREFSVRFFGDQYVSRVLERVVSAASVQANLSVDQLNNALASMETLVTGVNSVLPSDAARCFQIAVADGRVDVAIIELTGDQPHLIREATTVDGLGDLLSATATKVFEFRDGGHSALAVSIA